MTTQWIYLGGAVLFLLVIGILWKQIVRAVLALAALGLIGLLLWTFAQQATATRQIAQAATVAARGSAVANITVLLLVALVCVGVIVVGVYLGLRRHAQMTRWQELDAPQYPEFPPAQSDPGALNALVQLEVLRALRELRTPEQSALVALNADAATDDNSGYEMWWGNA